MMRNLNTKQFRQRLVLLTLVCMLSAGVSYGQSNTPPLSLVATGINASCNGSLSGSIVAVATGGQAPYLYSLPGYPSNTTGKFDNLPAGSNYVVTVTDANNATFQATAVAVANTVVNVAVSASSPTICTAGGSVNLAASGATDYFWSALPPGTPIPSTASVTVSPTVTTTYTVVGYSITGNLIFNGDFSLGNVGFNTSYQYVSAADNAASTTPVAGESGLEPEGTYAVDTNAHIYHDQFWGSHDHTTGSGNYMIINGSPTVSSIVWLDTVQNLLPNTNYYFTAWIKALNNIEAPATMNFSINGNPIGPIITVPSDTTAGWVAFHAVWNSGSDTYAAISIVDTSTIRSGNDFGLDDISFSPACADTTQVTINVGQTPTITLAGGNVTCFGLANGTDTAYVTPVSATDQFSWSTSPSQTTSVATGLAAGGYSVTVNDGNGCTASASNAITQPSTALGANLTNTSAGGGLFNLTATGSGGTAPYTYTFGGDAVGTIDANAGTDNGVPAGNYSVTVTDAHGCSAVASDNFGNPVRTNSCPLVISKDTTVCYATCANLSVSGATSFTWSVVSGDPTLTTNGVANITVCPSVTTTYSVTGTSNSGNLIPNGSFELGNTGFTSDYEYISAAANAATTSPVAGESGLVPEGTYTVDTNAHVYHPQFWGSHDHTSGSGNYLIVNGSPYDSVLLYVDTIPVQPNTNYTFSAWVKAVNNVGAPGTLNFSINDQVVGPIINIPADTTTGWVNFTDSWFSGANTQAVLTIVDTNTIRSGNDFGLDDLSFSTSCSTTKTVTVTVPSAPVTATLTSTLVSTNSYNLTATGNGGTGPYSFNFGSTLGTNTTGTISGVTTGSYSVTVTDANGCSSVAVDTIRSRTNVGCNLTVTASNDTSVCFGACANISASGADSYTWTVLSGDFNLPVANLAGITVCPTVTSTYSVTGTTTSGSGLGPNLIPNGDFSLGNTGFTSAYDYISAAANAATTSPYPGQSGLIPEGTYAVDTNAHIYHPEFWGSHDHTTGNGNYLIVNGSPYDSVLLYLDTITVLPNTNYTFSAWIKAVNNYAENGTLNFSINDHLVGPIIVIPSDTTTGWVQFTDNWFSGSSTTAVLTIVDTNTVRPGNDFGLDDIYLGLSNGGPCTATATVTVTVDPLINLSSGTRVKQALCSNSGDASISVVPAGGTSPFTYCFVDLTSNDTTCTSTSNTLAGLADGSYEVIVKDALGCSATTDNTVGIPVHAPAPIVTNISANICSGDSYAFNGLSLTAPGSYNETLTAANGCDSTVILTLGLFAPGVGSNTTASICPGGSYSFGGQTLTAAGTYYNANQTADGCSYYDTLTLNLFTAGVGTNVTASICPGSSYSFGSQTLTSAGTYYNANQTADGCTYYDTLTLNLFTQGAGSNTTASICTGLSYNFGGQTLTIAGTYYNANQTVDGCTYYDTLTLNLYAPILLTTMGSDLACNGHSDGTVSVTASGGSGVGTYTYLWSDVANQTTAQASGLTAGTYFVTVSDANGCSATDDATVYQPSAVNAAVTTQINYDCGLLGSATITATGGTAPYNFTWSPVVGSVVNVLNTTTQADLTPGIYTISVSDDHGCATSINDTIVNAPVTATLSVTNPSCNGLQLGAIEATVTGGSGSFTYEWSTGAIDGPLGSSDGLFGLAQGMYSVTVIDNGTTCTSQSANLVKGTTVNITVTPSSATVDPGQCTTLSATGATYYFWSPSGSLHSGDSTLATQTACPDSTTIYTVTGYTYIGNLIVNGDFESPVNNGNSGFTAGGYTYVAPNAPGGQTRLVPEGYYAVDTNAHLYHTLFWGSQDHTGLTASPAYHGHYLIVNGSPVAGSIVWEENVQNIEIGQDYFFTTWIKALNNIEAPATMQFAIDGVPLPTLITAPADTQDGWIRYYAVWNANEDHADITIVDTSTIRSGNDFGLDDITFSQTCTSVKYDTVIVANPNAPRLAAGLPATSNADGLSVELLPNPAHDQVSVTFNANAENKYHFEVMDMKGAKVYTTDGKTIIGENNLLLDISSFSQGLYLVHITSEENAVYPITRLIKQ